jgi:hypothetical protein
MINSIEHVRELQNRVAREERRKKLLRRNPWMRDEMEKQEPERAPENAKAKNRFAGK